LRKPIFWACRDMKVNPLLNVMRFECWDVI
jgi:hypothetical protein